MAQSQFTFTLKKEGTQIAAFRGVESIAADIVETDPVFSASAASVITNNDISNWNNKSDFSGNYFDLTGAPQFSYSNGTLTITI